MKTLRFALAGAALATLVFVATAAAAGPTPGPAGKGSTADTIPAVLGLTQAEVNQLRHDGLSLAQIAEREKVDPQKLIDALVAQWGSRIDVRVANGALTAAEAAKLKEQLPVQAKAMVYQVTLGGMQGAAVGAGPGSAGAGTGARMGTGTRMGAPAAAGAGTGATTGAPTGAGMHRGANRGAGTGTGSGAGSGTGAGTGTGTCDGTGPHGPATR